MPVEDESREEVDGRRKESIAKDEPVMTGNTRLAVPIVAVVLYHSTPTESNLVALHPPHEFGPKDIADECDLSCLRRDA